MHRMTTKEILAESFKELAKTKPINKITVTNITDNCDMSQPTFYNHFKDKYDLIIWIYLQEIKKQSDKIVFDGFVWKDTISSRLKYFADNRQFIVNAIKNTSGMDSFVFKMTQINVDFITNEVKRRAGEEELSEDITALIKMYACGTGQYLCRWLMEPNPMSCEELSIIFEEFIPEKLRPYLCE